MRPGDKMCCVPECRSGSLDKVPLHLFPNPDRLPKKFANWVQAVGGELLKLPSPFIYKNRRVCHRHFEIKFLARYNRLVWNAVPTLHCFGQSSALQCLSRQSLENTPLQLSLFDNSPDPLKEEPSQSEYGYCAKEEPTQIEYINCSSEETSQVEYNYCSKEQNLQKPKNHFCTSTEKQLTKKIIDLSKKLKQGMRRLELYKKRYAAVKKLRKINCNKVAAKMTPAAQLLFEMQRRETKKRSRGRRYSRKEKLLAMLLYEQGPKSYHFLSQFLVLPSMSTISKMLSDMPNKSSFSVNCFEELNKEVVE